MVPARLPEDTRLHKIVIIMTVMNGGQWLKTSIDSLISSTHYPFRLLLVESESSDGSEKMCDWYSQNYEFIESYHVPENGAGRAINWAIKNHTTDEDVYLTHDDCIHYDLPQMDWLASLMTMANKEKVGMVSCLDGGGISGPTFLDGLKWYGTWCMFIPRKTLNLFDNLFDENMKMGDDIELSFRIWNVGLEIWEYKFWVNHHRLTEHPNYDRHFDEINENGKYFRKKYGIKEGTTFKEYAKDDLQKTYTWDQAEMVREGRKIIIEEVK